MKRKPLLITLGIIVVLAGGLSVAMRRNNYVPEINGVKKFIAALNARVESGNRDSVRACFQVTQKQDVLYSLVDVLTPKETVKGNDWTVYMMLQPDSAAIKIPNNEFAEVSVPVHMTGSEYVYRRSVLKFRISRVAEHSYKIVEVDANQMMADYHELIRLVNSKRLPDKDIYTKSTLQAFKTAKTLTGKYDTVTWFAHLNNQIYYYVVNGKWDQERDIEDDSRDSVKQPYKMGLVGPDLKEIIPARFDVVHSINATFPGMVEVEKDGKKGFFNLSGKNVVPVSYDQVLPVDDNDNLAVLRIGADYFYLKKDFTISPKTDLKVAGFFRKIKNIGGPQNLYNNAMSVVTEYNSRFRHGAIYIPPSYLTDLAMAWPAMDFQNPLRKNVRIEEVSRDYKIGFSTEMKSDQNWLTASFYAIKDYYLGGRSEFYTHKNIVIFDKKKNQVFASHFRGRESDLDFIIERNADKSCIVDNIRALNDSIYEVKSGTAGSFDLYDSTRTITGSPYYCYYVIRNNKMAELPDNRIFAFTKYVKMNDSYLAGCYQMLTGEGRYKDRKKEALDHVTPDILRFMKNEIYADYGYQFKDKRWQKVFANMFSYYDKDGNRKPGKASVQDSLTAIDKYNINWIDQKLKTTKSNTLASK